MMCAFLSVLAGTLVAVKGVARLQLGGSLSGRLRAATRSHTFATPTSMKTESTTKAAFELGKTAAPGSLNRPSTVALSPHGPGVSTGRLTIWSPIQKSMESASRLWAIHEMARLRCSREPPMSASRWSFLTKVVAAARRQAGAPSARRSRTSTSASPTGSTQSLRPIQMPPTVCYSTNIT